MKTEELMEYIADQIASIKGEDCPLLVSVDGVDTSGKTIFSRLLAEKLKQRGYDTTAASVDGFHNPREIRYSRGADSPEGFYRDSYNYAALLDCLVLPFKEQSGKGFCTAVYDSVTESKVHREPRKASKASILLMEGIFLHRPELAEFWDYSIFLHVDFQQVIKRARVRDRHLIGSAEAAEKRYRSRYIPGQQLYMKEADPFSSAALVIDNNDYNSPRIVSGEKEINELRKRALEFV
jgi:uridine kinase